MRVLAAPGDTWGIPGPTFLGFYLLAGLVVVIGAILHRQRVLAGPPNVRKRKLGPQQVAYLNGGDQLAVWTSLGGLRGTGVVGVRADRRLAVGGPLPAGVTPLDRAVHHAANQGLYARELGRDRWVAQALDQLRQGLEQQGLALTAAQRHAARRGSYLLFGLVVLGLFRIVAGLSNNRPVGFLVVAVIPLAIASALIARVPRRTRAADRALHELRRKNVHLAPAAGPAYATYGAAGAAMGVALFGTATLWAMDPGFAEQAEIQRQALAGTGSSWVGGGGSSGSSSSCSGGSSCGGGGGCGGGGCGG
ncbi:TIGR04222 domain-containing membrane protein [Micromonospora sp. WMMD956]|uniref:TIGR04222 domain-containing membrane protein n=1 Tax=Micromonospora sp. WMMD956 TaxID=3016108 RepID=UPI0024160B1A|nr:TIGR04222 domain-containing membrane protein [Micromonospora sp. WMMD956]MDG4814310.1 TIGR04222 domain-containing membrane protein [Micromonospora sp. WMMD956]